MLIGIVISIVLGLAGGWIVNYLADVLPATRRLSQPTCPHCETPVLWTDYLLFRRCRSCGTSRRARAWVTLLLVAAITIYTQFVPPPRLGFLAGWVLLLYFSTVFVIDLEHRLILHPTSLVGVAIALFVGYLREYQGADPSFWNPLLGGLFGFGVMYLFYLLGVLFSKIRARRMRAAGLETDDEDALGAGDVILAGILGLMIGWPLIWFGLLLGVLLGGAVSALIMLGLFVTRRYHNNAWMMFIPFGPFFITSAFMILYLPRVAAFFTFQS